jgi:hypothetical protein
MRLKSSYSPRPRPTFVPRSRQLHQSLSRPSRAGKTSHAATRQQQTRCQASCTQRLP